MNSSEIASNFTEVISDVVVEDNEDEESFNPSMNGENATVESPSETIKNETVTENVDMITISVNNTENETTTVLPLNNTTESENVTAGGNVIRYFF